MNVDMLPLEIIGLKTDLQVIVQALRSLGCVQIDSLAEFPAVSARPLVLDENGFWRRKRAETQICANPR